MTSLFSQSMRHKRHIGAVLGVLGAHGAALWLLSMAFERTSQPSIVPAEIVVQWVTPDAPTPPSPPPPAPVRQPQPKVNRATPLPTPASVAPTIDSSAPVQAATAPATETTISPPAPAAPSAPQAVAPTIAPKLEMPSTNADYLNNPRPPYPPLSKRLGEQGKVVLRVYIETNGTASQAEVRTSSGYDRLDQTALKTVLQWRYVPGKRNGVPEAMWFNVPINFVLE